MPLILAGATSGSTTLQATDAVTATITLPSATDTLVGKTTPSFTTTIGVGAATPSASGAGITFPATQSASSNANTLDDYEEGTWTPVVAGLTTAGTGTYTIQSGSYTKVGRIVTITCTVGWTAHTGTGNMIINAIPFASGNIVTAAEYMNVPEFLNMTMPASTIPMGLIANNSSSINLYTSAVGTGVLSSLAMDSAASIYMSITYQTA